MNKLLDFRKNPTPFSIVELLTDPKKVADIENPETLQFAISYLFNKPHWMPLINDEKNERYFKIDILERRLLILNGCGDGEWRDSDKLFGHNYFYTGTIVDAITEFVQQKYSLYNAIDAHSWVEKQFREKGLAEKTKEYTKILDANRNRSPNDIFVIAEQTSIDKLF